MTSNLSEYGYIKVLDFSERTKFNCYILDQLINEYSPQYKMLCQFF